MNRKTKKITKVVRLLTDPEPEFVSLVGHGANQTPFRVVKMADFRAEQGDTDMSFLKNATRSRSRIARTDSIAVAEVQKITFATSNFADEATVKKYLDDHGYENYEVAKIDGGFEVVSKAAEDFEGEIRMVKAANGVVIFAGSPKELPAEGTEKAADAATQVASAAAVVEGASAVPIAEGAATAAAAETTQKTEAPAAAAEPAPLLIVRGMNSKELVAKYSGYMAQFSEGKTLTEVMAAGADGLPPGIYEVNDAFYTALRNSVSAGDMGSVRRLTKEFGDVIVKMVETFSDATIPDDGVQKMVAEKAVVETPTTLVEKTDAEKAAEAAVKPIAGDAPAATVEKTEAEVAAAAAVAEPVAKTDAPDFAALITAAVKTAVDPLVSRVEGIEGVVKEAASKTTETLGELRTEVTKANARVETLENTRQTRKSADADGVNAGTEQPEKKNVLKAQDDPLVRGRLGFMRTR